MRVSKTLAIAVAILALNLPDRARADGSPTDRVLCHMATVAAERATGVPDQLLTAISRVESGRVDAATGRSDAWPWTINVEGTGHFYESKDAAMAAVVAFRAQGARSIDVGCMQINLKQHPEAFASLDDAFDPPTNAMFRARFLRGLFEQTGSWPHAAAAYHSLTPEVGRDYQNQVLQMWARGDTPQDPGGGKEDKSHGTPGPNASGSLFTSTGSTGGSPFGGAPSTFVATRYGPRPTLLQTTQGRGLAEYRNRPIALASRMISARGF